MDNTHHLQMPFIMAAQAQKHVTHNEALTALDALVQLAVDEVDVDTPPADPSEGTRMIVGSQPEDAFANHATEIAAFQDGAWNFYSPRDGWLVWSKIDSSLLVFEDGTWVNFGQSDGVFDRLAVNTGLDENHMLALSGSSSMFSHEGSGHRLIINRASPTDIASLLFQTAFEGQFEAGLFDQNSFRLKGSMDGSDFSDLLIADAENNQLFFPAVPSLARGGDLLINGDFSINQRNFAGGSLADETFGFDRWKAIGSTEITATGGTVNLSAGTIRQTVETPALANQSVCFSVEDVTSDMTVSIADQSQTVSAQTGRQGIVFELDETQTGNIAVDISASDGPASFTRCKLQRGRHFSGWIQPGPGEELQRCRRYFQSLNLNLKTGASATSVSYVIPLNPVLARAPDVTRISSLVTGSEEGTAVINSPTITSEASFGIFNGGTGALGGRFWLDAEID